MPYCPNCGVEVDGEQKFCGECGARLALDPLPNEPVYTDDERLKNDPALASGDPAPKQKKAPKIPELTLEPDLWGIPVEKPAAEPKRPKKEPELTLEPDVWGLGAAAAAAADLRHQGRAHFPQQHPPPAERDAARRRRRGGGARGYGRGDPHDDPYPAMRRGTSG